eukprot:TRINITY_DN21695_c0_g1_i1.p1 TRINITY_DN21695_c0_g1~~TRINITY_DN21695_c0_g1_i1.p1  ORF type:complete len:309 (+),score=33.06 TRINITY_DN21695_c0_g1_i1:238-1164(+)
MVLSILFATKPQVFQFCCQAAGSEDADFDNDGTLARLMLASDCFLVVKTYEADTQTNYSHHVVQWDILYGNSYELEDGLATCSWDMHLRRVVESSYDSGGHQRIAEGEMDSGWDKMDARASFKWRRIQTTDVVDDRALAEKLESWTFDDLWESIAEDLRSNGMRQTQIDMWEEFLDECDGFKADVLHKELLEIYRGNGKLPPSSYIPLQVAVRLFPGATLGPSGCWCRLPESVERNALGTAPGVDCSVSSLLGIVVHGLENISRFEPETNGFRWQRGGELVSDDGFCWRIGKPIDLSELRQLLKMRGR